MLILQIFSERSNSGTRCIQKFKENQRTVRSCLKCPPEPNI